MNKKCVGCGAILQSNYPLKEGYIEPEMINKDDICRRCFRLKFYGDFIYINKSNQDYEKIMEQISSTGDLVIYLIDAFSISNELINVDKLLKNPFLLVINKRDLLPKSVNDNKIVEYLKKYKLDIIDSLIISAEKNYNIDRLYKLINKHKKSSKVYLVGNTNAGKSTLINKMLKDYAKSKSFLTTSLLPTTTLDIMEIKLSDNLTIIDTPGFIEDGNIVNYLDYATLTKVTPKKEIKPKVYQLNKDRSLLVKDILQLDYIEGESNSFVFYISNELDILNKKTNINYLMMKPKKIRFETNEEEDVVIPGLGWIKISKPAIIDIVLNENVKVFKRKSLI